jgi:hypothetical protein
MLGPSLKAQGRARALSFTRGTMKYLVPPIVIPILLVVGITAYAILRPPLVVGHAPAPAASSQPR